MITVFLISVLAETCLSNTLNIHYRTRETLSNTTEYYVQHKITVAVPGIRSWISPSQKRDDEMIAFDLKSYVIY